MSASDLPSVNSLAAGIDLAARIAAFDGGDGTLVHRAAELWTIIEPDAATIVEAYWGHWRKTHPGQPEWTRLQGEERRIAGMTYLRNRFCRLDRCDWVEHLGRVVGSAYAKQVTTMDVLAMTCASDRAALRKYAAPTETPDRNTKASALSDSPKLRGVRYSSTLPGT